MMDLLNNNNLDQPFADVKEAFNNLQEALKKIDTDESWINYLNFQAKFYNYSYSNVFLISLQNPYACYVAGYNKWLKLGRFVKKGEHAIKIFAPCKYKVENEESVSCEYIVKGFKLVSVFDISQTGGDDDNLPVLITGLKESVHDEDFIYQAFLSSVDIQVSETDTLTSKGCYHISDPMIEIKSSLSVLQKIKTLSHELAHHLHHTKYFENENRDICEVIAESSAYVVCRYLNIDTSSYSLGYIKSWCKDVNHLQKISSKVQRISSDIINLINISPGNTEKFVAV